MTDPWARIDNSRATTPPPEPAVTLADLNVFMAALPPREDILTRIEAGPVAQAALKAAADPVEHDHRHGARPFGVPIVDLPAGVGHPGGCCWRAINAAGGVKAEGCVVEQLKKKYLDQLHNPRPIIDLT